MEVQETKTTVQEKLIVTNYPYGRLQTTAFFSLEFKEGKGFRSIFQTINPKTGRVNNEKKGIYNDLMYMTSIDGFVKFHSLHFYKIEEYNQLTTWLKDNFALFTQEQMQYLYNRALSYLKMEAYALKVYCNVPASASMPLLEPALQILREGIANPDKNLWENITIDHEALTALKDPNYNPFKVTSYGV